MKIPEKFKHRKHIQTITIPQKYKNHLIGNESAISNNEETIQTCIIDFQDIQKNKRYTNQELINILKSEANKLGRSPPSSHFMNNPSLPTYSTFKTRWSNWNNVLKVAGLSISNPRTKKRYTEEQLLMLLIIESKKLGRTPTAPHFQFTPGLPSVESYVSRWGSWNNAIKAAGLTPNAECYRNKEKKDTFELLMEKPQHRININALRLEERQQIYWILIPGLKKVFFLEGDEDRAISEFIEMNRNKLKKIKFLNYSSNQSKIPNVIDRKYIVNKINDYLKRNRN